MIVRLIILRGRKAGVTKREKKKENHGAEKPKSARVVDANKLIK